MSDPVPFLRQKITRGLGVSDIEITGSPEIGSGSFSEDLRLKPLGYLGWESVLELDPRKAYGGLLF